MNLLPAATNSFFGAAGLSGLFSQLRMPHHALRLLGEASLSSDTFDKSEAPAFGDQSLGVNELGLYSIQASIIVVTSQSLTFSPGAEAEGSDGQVVVDKALKELPAEEGNPLSRLRHSLRSLGFDKKSVRILLRLAQMLFKLDRKALQQLADRSEGLARGAGSPNESEPSSTFSGEASQFRLSYASLRVSVSEINGQFAGGQEGSAESVSLRRFELRFESLEVFLSRTQVQPGDPRVAELNGDGPPGQPSSDDVVFSVAGSGQAVRTALVRGEDVIPSDEAQDDGSLDGDSGVTGNRIGGFDESQELEVRDEGGDSHGSRLESRLLKALGLEELSALWEHDEADEEGGHHRVVASDFTREDGKQGKIFNYLFGNKVA